MTSRRYGTPVDAQAYRTALVVTAGEGGPYPECDLVVSKGGFVYRAVHDRAGTYSTGLLQLARSLPPPGVPDTRKIVVNACYGGYSLSPRALHALGLNEYADAPARDDPELVALVESMGEGAAGPCALLKVVEIPADVDWEIQEHDGQEWVAERHRTWWPPYYHGTRGLTDHRG